MWNVQKIVVNVIIWRDRNFSIPLAIQEFLDFSSSTENLYLPSWAKMSIINQMPAPSSSLYYTRTSRACAVHENVHSPGLYTRGCHCITASEAQAAPVEVPFCLWPSFQDWLTNSPWLVQDSPSFYPESPKSWELQSLKQTGTVDHPREGIQVRSVSAYSGLELCAFSRNFDIDRRTWSWLVGSSGGGGWTRCPMAQFGLGSQQPSCQDFCCPFVFPKSGLPASHPFRDITYSKKIIFFCDIQIWCLSFIY